MFSIGVRLIWLVITSIALSYGSYLVVVQSVLTQESGTDRPVQLIDQLRPGVHYISGMVTVPNACAELTVHIVHTSEYNYELKFETWEEPSIRCARDPVPRHFATIAFAPAAGVRFTAQLNGIPFVIRMKQSVITEKDASEAGSVRIDK